MLLHDGAQAECHAFTCWCVPGSERLCTLPQPTPQPYPALARRSYARTSKGNVIEWNRFTREYFAERETLVT